MITKKQIFLIIPIFILGIVLLILFFWSNNQKQKPEPVTFTGAKLATNSPQEATYANQRYELRTASPVNKDEFTITYNVKEAKFIVTINPPFDQNKKAFDAWLKDNNFDKIPSSDFTLNTP